MLNFINANPEAFWFAVGFVALAVEALVLGFSTGALLFVGIGALITGGLFFFELLPNNWIAGIATFALSTAIATVVLWKPLKKLQGDKEVLEDTSSDLIGHRFRLSGDIAKGRPGKTRFSGIEWRVEIDDRGSDDVIAEGEPVEVSDVDAGVFRVRRI